MTTVLTSYITSVNVIPTMRLMRIYRGHRSSVSLIRITLSAVCGIVGPLVTVA